MLFLYGNISILAEKNCHEGKNVFILFKNLILDCPVFWFVSLIYLINCYVYFIIPIISIFSICICFSQFLTILKILRNSFGNSVNFYRNKLIFKFERLKTQ